MNKSRTNEILSEILNLSIKTDKTFWEIMGSTLLPTCNPRCSQEKLTLLCEESNVSSVRCAVCGSTYQKPIIRNDLKEA